MPPLKKKATTKATEGVTQRPRLPVRFNSELLKQGIGGSERQEANYFRNSSEAVATGTSSIRRRRR